MIKQKEDQSTTAKTVGKVEAVHNKSTYLFGGSTFSRGDLDQDTKSPKRPTLAEVVTEIKKQQDAQKDANNPSLEDQPPLPRKRTTPKDYTPSPYATGAAQGPYSGVMASRSGPYSKEDGYNPSGSDTSNKPSAPPQIGLTNDEVREIMEDAKMRSWGLGGDGKHRSLHTQQVYDVVRFTTASFAMNQIIYRLALN